MKGAQMIRSAYQTLPLNIRSSWIKRHIHGSALVCLIATLASCQSSDPTTGSPTDEPSPIAGHIEESTGGDQTRMDPPEGGALSGGVESGEGGVERRGGESVDEEAHAGDEESPMMADGLERLIARLPSGPPPERFDCRALPYQPPMITPERALRVHCLHTEGCDEKLIVGHRGVGGDFGYIAPETSLSAIRAALELGLDGVELDVRHTLDEELVLMHDSSIDRTTVDRGAVHQMTATMLTATRLKPPPISLDRADTRGEFECETVPTLERALALTRGRLFIDLDMKTDRVD